MTNNHKETPTTGPDRVPRPEQKKNKGARPSHQAAARTHGGTSRKDTTPLPETTIPEMTVPVTTAPETTILETTVPENTTYSGLRGNMITFLAERQNQAALRLDARIDKLDQRLTLLEERENPE